MNRPLGASNRPRSAPAKRPVATSTALPGPASPLGGDAGPGSAVLVIGARLAGAERGRLLAWSGRFILLDIFV